MQIVWDNSYEISTFFFFFFDWQQRQKRKYLKMSSPNAFMPNALIIRGWLDVSI